MSLCPCGSGREFADCCEPFILGNSLPETAEQLMRSRYSAYASEQVEYLHDSLHPQHREDHDINAARKWAKESDWLGLEIVATEQGGADDATGVVEFRASYRDKGVTRQVHEISRFEKVDGRWYYVDGDMPKPETVRHEAKVGRNDPCPCGSGKKYKKCCGR
ncbi:MAG: YchJ family protein [Chromatiales bacterium]|jgi:SEC-C motif-containing protein